MTAPKEVQDERNAEWWADIPEPPELTAWAEQRAKAKAAKKSAGKALCATCGKERAHADHLYVASRNTVRCVFVEASR